MREPSPKPPASRTPPIASVRDHHLELRQFVERAAFEHRDQRRVVDGAAREPHARSGRCGKIACATADRSADGRTPARRAKPRRASVGRVSLAPSRRSRLALSTNTPRRPSSLTARVSSRAAASPLKASTVGEAVELAGMLADQLRHLVVDALDRAGRDVAVGILDEGGRRVDHARSDAGELDRRQQRILTLQVSVDRSQRRPGRGRQRWRGWSAVQDGPM